MGWEPIREEPPNNTPLADDLIAALRRLQLEREGKSMIEVLIPPEDGTGIGVYVEDCDDGVDKGDFGEVEEWPFTQLSSERIHHKPLPTAMPPMPAGA